MADRNIHLRLSDAARAYLAERGYDPTYGARPLKRLIQREVENPLAMRVLAAEVREGETVQVDRDPEAGLTFRVAEPAPVTA
jgi:ATP-dependent Clp protease ATP-binding subunit ClpA